MLFLASFAFLQYTALFAFFRALQRRQNGMVLLLLLVGIAGMFAGLTIFGFVDSAVDLAFRTNVCVPLFFIFGIGSAIVFGIKLFQIFKSQSVDSPSWRYGLAIWAVAAGLYISGAAVDHWIFFRDGEHSGIAAADLLGVKDIKCESMILVRTTSQTAIYRCPKSWAWGTYSDHPFVPWPSYQEGESADLKNRLEALQRDMKSNDPRK